MNIIGKELIVSEVTKIAETLPEEEKTAIMELLWYYKWSESYNEFHEKNTAKLHKMMHNQFMRDISLYGQLE